MNNAKRGLLCLVLGSVFVLKSVGLVHGIENTHESAEKTAKAVDRVGNAQIVISTLMGEALGEGVKGMQAVAEVLRNRARARGTTMSQEAMRPKQFSFWNDREQAKAWIADNVDGKGYDMAMEALGLAENGSNVAGSADHYFNPKLARPAWAKRMTKTVSIGGHDFYKA